MTDHHLTKKKKSIQKTSLLSNYVKIKPEYVQLQGVILYCNFFLCLI